MFLFTQRAVSAALLLFVLAGCVGVEPAGVTAAGGGTGRADPHSFSRPEEIAVRHIELDLAVDFEARTIQGTARLDLEHRTGANELVLDSNGLVVERVSARSASGERPVAWRSGEGIDGLGRPLLIEVGPEDASVTVAYRTGPEAHALQWLRPEQTADGVAPFLFTQSQAIHARSWVPCQDTPGVRITYAATIRVPPGLLAVMSASNPRAVAADGAYRFEMPQRIPPYLLALAVGRVEFRSLGERTGVYAEPSVLESAAHEFSDTERMVEAAEALYGPYRWERYDIIVLPPSFPWGGMENPRLTFATPTIIAGDRSLVALVAHELAHSWSGNLVTNATWNEFWLNEGFTVYFEQRIMEALYGREYTEMLASLSWDDLQEDLEHLPARDTWLALDLAGREPEEGMTSIAYDKGAFFLRHCEETVGRERWDRFLRSYFDENAFGTMTTEAFVERLRRDLVREDTGLADRLEIDAWVWGPGVPEGFRPPRSTAFGRVADEAFAFAAGKAAGDLETDGWSAHEWLHFLRSMPKDLDDARLAELDGVFRLTAHGNAEIVSEWLQLAILADYEPAFGRLESFVSRVGRLKLIRPLYKLWMARPQGADHARSVYARARAGYHPITSTALDEIVR